MRVLRGGALAEPLLDDDDNDNDRPTASAASAASAATTTTTAAAATGAAKLAPPAAAAAATFLGSSGDLASPMTQSAIQGSVFYPPAFPPTIGQDSVMLKSFNEYRPPHIRMEAADLRQPNRNAPSPSLLIEKR